MRRCEVLGALMRRDICYGQPRQTNSVPEGRRNLADQLSPTIRSHPEQPRELCLEPGFRSHEKLLQPKRFGLAQPSIRDRRLFRIFDSRAIIPRRHAEYVEG